jgi:type I restriction enzyme R subunit
VVDYLGLADQLKKALADYTESGGKGKPTFDQEEAVAKMLEYFEICTGLFHGFDYSKFKTGKPRERLAVIPPAIEHVLSQDKGKDRLLKTVTQLSRAFALSIPHDRAIAIRDDVGFFQTVRAGIAKTTTTGGRDEEELNTAIRQIVSRAVSSDRVIDIFSAAGLKSPEISILSDEFLSEVKGLPQRNLAFEALKKLLTDEIKVRSKTNLSHGSSPKCSKNVSASIRIALSKPRKFFRNSSTSPNGCAKPISAATTWASPRKSWPSTTPSKSTTAQLKSSATKP